MRKPRIGITMRLESETRRFYLGRDYSEAIQGLGGIPTHISLIPEREYISHCLDDLDGVFLPGSDTDVDPLRFGEEPHSKLGRVIIEKEETDLLVIEEAEKRNLPILGICFGMQILNVFRGGTLVQDIASQIPASLKHQQGHPLARNSHTINIAENSTLERLIMSGEARVNSHHHQSVKEVGKNLKATAWAKDGVIESIEDTRENQFVLGVQWHPELSWQTDELSRKIFETFIEKCK
ncbi:MAG: gamma-glutamyl-gamma-aminobutyrate hydrolase family protein [Pyrinomonadaceae bacterium]|nr:gamma-glutamyl-gamma-aminobutyrate hydrolase family protein [Pyrinomonadaceae bacterium]